MQFTNSWDDYRRAMSYAALEFPNTYYLAYRDLPEIYRNHASGTRAIDFGCGAGRSTRFLKREGFSVTGIDVAADMLQLAREADPAGTYIQIRDGDYDHLGINGYDLVQSVFTFDNIPGREHRLLIMKGLTRLLRPGGTMLLLDSTPELYTREWASFSTKEFKQNFTAVSGGIVCTRMKDVEDTRPVEDVFWTREDYLQMFDLSGLNYIKEYRPLGRPDEGIEWINETMTAPWVIYVVKKP